MAKKYDAVVIGAGLGGMSAATLIAKQGKSVLLLERHNIPGGYATSFCRGRFEFDVALHELSGVKSPDGAPGDLYQYLDAIGVAEKIEFLPMPDLYRVVDDNIDMTLPANRDECEEMLMEKFPGEAEGIENFFETTVNVMKDYKAIIASAAARSEDFSVEKFPTFTKNGMKTYGEVLDSLIKDETLKSVLSPYWGYAGLPPSKVPFQLMSAIWDAFLTNPPHHIRGRCQALSNAFMDTFFESGGVVKFNTGVKKINVKDGKVTGVITDEDEEITASVVVSNANPLSTMINLVGPEHTPREFQREMNSKIIGFSTVNLYIGLDCPPETIGANVHENFLNMGSGIEEAWERGFTMDPPSGILFTCYNVTDPLFSPPGTSVVVMTATAYARPWYMIPPDRYVEVKNQFAEGMLNLGEKYFPGLREHIEVIEVATPVTNMRYTGNPGGAIYGTDQYLSDSGLLRLQHKAPVDGLFFAGAWTIPGGGFQPSIAAGSIAGGRALGKLMK